MHLCKSFRWGEERLHRSPKSFRWGEERLHRSPKSLRWDEEPLYRSPRVKKFYTFLPAKHGKWGTGRKSKANVSGGTRNHCTAVPEIRSRALWRPVFGHAVRCILLGANNQWGPLGAYPCGMKKPPLIEVSLYVVI